MGRGGRDGKESEDRKGRAEGAFWQI